MDVREAINTRRSIRRYKQIAVKDQLILDCLDAARGAPSANNSNRGSS